MTQKAKILILDIETAPNIVYSWGLHEQEISTNQVVQDGYVLCWCAKWLGQREIMSDALPNYSTAYHKDPTNDGHIAQSIWKLMEQADIVVTHNGNSFDLKWLNTIFIENGLPPCNPNKSVDTYLVAKRHFRFLSNKLDFLCRKFNFGGKHNTGGFKLWDDCMHGDLQAWGKMVTYCKQDVALLEKLYIKLRPFMSGHPNINAYGGSLEIACDKCGSKRIQKRGWRILVASKYRKYQCQDCGAWMRDTKRIPLSPFVKEEKL